MLICMSKISFSIRFFLDILPFKESCNWICWLNFGPQLEYPEIYQIWDWQQNINIKISFHFRLFPTKTNVKVFQKMHKLLIIPIDYHFAKNQKKLMCNSWEKMPNWRTDRQTGNLIVLSVGQRSNYQSIFKLFWIYINTPKTILFH